MDVPDPAPPIESAAGSRQDVGVGPTVSLNALLCDFAPVPPADGPTVSILIPLYNYEQYISPCIESILRQTYDNLEIVIVDNASTDNSFEEARRACGDDPRVTIHRNDTHVGVVENFRRCYEMSSAPLVRFVSADDCFAVPHAVSRLVAAVQSGPDVVLSLSQRSMIDERGEPIGSTPPAQTSDFTADGREYGDVILRHAANPLGFSILFRRELLPMSCFDSIGGYTITSYLDSPWILNLMTSGRIAFVNEILDHFRHHEGQESGRMVGSPVWLTEHFKIVKGAITIGYLADPEAEQQCWSELLNKFLSFPWFAEMMEAMDSMRQISERVADLTRQIGAVPSDSG